MQLTQKKTTLQFKALDQTLQTINRETNQKEALTYRCADMDRIVPSLMGVSKVQPCLLTYRHAGLASPFVGLCEQHWHGCRTPLHLTPRRCRCAMAGLSRRDMAQVSPHDPSMSTSSWQSWNQFPPNAYVSEV